MKKVKKIITPFLLVLLAIVSLNINSAAATSKYADGQYNLPFTVLKGDSNESSMTNDYLVSPGKLIVKDGKNYVQLTLKNSSWWKEFNVQSKNVTVVSESNDTRVVQFEVQDLDTTINAKVHVIVPDINYDNKYDIRFKFDASGVSKAGKTETGNDGMQNNGEQKNDNSITEEKKGEKNPPTGDETPILLLSVILLASGFVVFRKVRFR